MTTVRRLMLPLLLLAAGLACAPDDTGVDIEPPDPTPLPAPPSTPTPTPQAIACSSDLPVGAKMADAKGRIGKHTSLTLALHSPKGTDAAVSGEGGAALIGAGVLQVGDIEKLLGLDVPGNAPDPGKLCAQSVDAKGQPAAGHTFADDWTTRNLAMTLRAPLGPAYVAALEAHKGWTEAFAARRVPGFAKPVDGRPYLLLAMTGGGAQGVPVRIDERNDLSGDAILSLVDAEGMAVFTTVHFQ